MNFQDLNVKQKQYLLAGVSGFFLLTLVGGAVYALFDTPQTPQRDSKETRPSPIETAGGKVNPQEVWVHRLENDFKLNNEKIEALEKLVTSKVGPKETEGQTGASPELETLRQEVEYLREEMARTANPMGNEGGGNQLPLPPGQGTLGGLNGMGNPYDSQDLKPQAISKVVFTLSPQNGNGNDKGRKGSKKNMSTMDDTIPAGAFARAVLLGGVDASTSINAASDPRPVLLRITDAGTLPRKLRSDLKNCHVLASSYGDLSSERVYMRLEKLTCTEPLTGEISETQVAGFVTGEDGRTGVRGSVVDRAGESVRNSAIGGFLSGMSGYFTNQQQRAVFPISPFGQTNALAPSQILGAGASNGVGNAMEKYSEFFIKRAEQLQPVLQVAAGREVNVVFTQGTKFGETSVKNTISNVRQVSRQNAIETLANNPETAELPKIEESTL